MKAFFFCYTNCWKNTYTETDTETETYSSERKYKTINILELRLLTEIDL